MSDDIAIKVEGLSKTFRLPHEKQASLKGALINFSKRGYEKQKVLNDISFEIKKGEFFGIVGRNGSGKSTLLKLLAGIYSPSKGSIQINGKLTPFIELGVGFNPELTGRENVFLNGALLGFSRSEMAAMYDDIVEFAELEKFMDQKLKNYSSGMQVRLAFSIAIRAESDILVLDEVLAVGDAAFQQKCNDYFGRIKNNNKTVILVTHDMSSVEKYCSSAMLLDGGEVRYKGEPQETTKHYSDINYDRIEESIEVGGEKRGTVTVGTQLLNASGKTKPVVLASEPKIKIEYTIKSEKQLNDVVLGTIISNSTGLPLFATNTQENRVKINLTPTKTEKLYVEVDNIFSNGLYTISAGIKDSDQKRVYFAETKSCQFVVRGRTHEFAATSPKFKIYL